MRRIKGIEINTKNWTRENLAWAAGLIEGEGCFVDRIPKTRKRVTPILDGWLPHDFRICVVMTDRDVLQKLKDILGCGRLTGPTRSGKSTNKPRYSYNICVHRHVYAIAVALYPYMGIRRKDRIKELILEFTKHSTPPRYLVTSEMRNNLSNLYKGVGFGKGKKIGV